MERLLVSSLPTLLDPSVFSADLFFDAVTGKGTGLSLVSEKSETAVFFPIAAFQCSSDRARITLLEPSSTVSPIGQSLLRLPVRTVSGQELGRVRDVVFLWEMNVLHQLVIGGMFSTWLKGELLVTWDDIEAIRPTEIIVRDRVLPVKVAAAAVAEVTGSSVGLAPTASVSAPSARMEQV